MTDLRAWWRDLAATSDEPAARALWAEIRAAHPSFRAAVVADARVTAANRGERYEYRSTLDTVVQAVRLAIVSDAFLAQCCYRAKAACQARRVPFVPRLLHRAAIVLGQVSIGDPVVVEAGVYLPHGQVVIDGVTRIGRGVVISPFVTIGLVAGTMYGPTVGARVNIGTNANVIGAVRVGNGATIGAGAVVVSDVPDRATVVGVPARLTGRD